MRSRSRSRSRQRHHSSRTGSSHGLASQSRKNDRQNRPGKGRSRSASVPRRGAAAASKRKSDGHRGGGASVSPKRRRHSDIEKGGAKLREVPRKQEADSTNVQEKSKNVLADSHSHQHYRSRHVMNNKSCFHYLLPPNWDENITEELRRTFFENSIVTPADF